MSRTRRQVTVRGLMAAPVAIGVPKCTALSIIAASRLWAEVMAWKSPVKCRLIFSIGSTCAWPPPVAPPLRPNTGPSDGSRSAITARRPMRLRASARPTVVVVLPSPAGVGLTAVTRISLPPAAGTPPPATGSRPATAGSALAAILAIKCPCGSMSVSASPSPAAIARMGRNVAARAISMSVAMISRHRRRVFTPATRSRARREGAICLTMCLP